MSHPPILMKRWSDGTDGEEIGVHYEYDIDVSDLVGIEEKPAMSRVITNKIDELRLADLAARCAKEKKK